MNTAQDRRQRCCLSLFPQSPKKERGSYFKTPLIRKSFLKESWSYSPPAFKHPTPPHSSAYFLRCASVFTSLLSYLDLCWSFCFSHNLCWMLATLKYSRNNSQRRQRRIYSYNGEGGSLHWKCLRILDVGGQRGIFMRVWKSSLSLDFQCRGLIRTGWESWSNSLKLVYFEALGPESGDVNCPFCFFMEELVNIS